MALLSLLTLVISDFSLFFLASPARVLSVLLIFSKNQLLVLLIFSVDFLFSTSFFSFLILITHFLWLSLDLVFLPPCPQFPKVGAYIIDSISVFFSSTCIQTIPFPQPHFFVAYINFDELYFHTLLCVSLLFFFKKANNIYIIISNKQIFFKDSLRLEKT